MKVKEIRTVWCVWRDGEDRVCALLHPSPHGITPCCHTAADSSASARDASLLLLGTKELSFFGVLQHKYQSCLWFCSPSIHEFYAQLPK